MSDKARQVDPDKYTISLTAQQYDDPGSPSMSDDIPNEYIAEQLLSYICPEGEPWTGTDPTTDHGHTQCFWIGLAIQRLRAS